MRLHQQAHRDRAESRIHHFRLSLLVAMLIMLSLVLVLRLAYLQISQYKRYATLSLKNQMSILPIAPPRGIIVDRNGVILAENIPVYVLEIVPEHIKNMPETLLQLKDLLPTINDDDIENFDRETDKVIQNLVNQVASTGRHNVTSMIYITHLLSDYKRTRLVLMEATGYVLYPQSTGSHALNYMLKTYVGMDSKESQALRKAGSRWVYIRKHYPSVLVTEHSAKIMNQ